uniref:NAD(P)-dependent oxidoreductase n=4 Tax=Staphylococcus TaxID=1279 RepID=UPI0034DB7280
NGYSDNILVKLFISEIVHTEDSFLLKLYYKFNFATEPLKETDTRAIIVGGAGSLYVDEAQTTKLMDTPEFSELFGPTAKGTSKGQSRNLEDLKASKGINWTFLSPSADFDAEGPKTKNYQAGKDNLLINSKGNSYVSYADFAFALVDEIENPQHKNERFTVVSEDN